MHIFGCLAFVHISNETHTKLEPSEKCIFVGYSDDKKAYRCYNLVTKKILISSNVKFEERHYWHTQLNTGSLPAVSLEYAKNRAATIEVFEPHLLPILTLPSSSKPVVPASELVSFPEPPSPVLEPSSSVLLQV